MVEGNQLEATGDPAVPRRWRRCSGLTLLELMLALALVAVLVVLAVGAYANYAERARVSEAIHHIGAMSVSINGFALINGRYPVDLSEVGLDGARDPWGNAYVYTDLTGPSRGAARKDRRLNPLNSDYDLFSMGRDGTYRTQITHATSLDDVIRARDGAFVDLAARF
jgi:general secretion pathway protein G